MSVPALGHFYQGAIGYGALLLLLGVTHVAWLASTFALAHAFARLSAVIGERNLPLQLLLGPAGLVLIILPTLLFVAWSVRDAYSHREIHEREFGRAETAALPRTTDRTVPVRPPQLRCAATAAPSPGQQPVSRPKPLRPKRSPSAPAHRPVTRPFVTT